jgi:hypothetical protein
LVNDQRDAQIIFYVFISIYNSLHVSNTSCLSSGETNCINTASGNSHPMMVAEMCAVGRRLNCASRLSFTKDNTCSRIHAFNVILQYIYFRIRDCFIQSTYTSFQTYLFEVLLIILYAKLKKSAQIDLLWTQLNIFIAICG